MKRGGRKEPNWFLVTSIGRTATYWLSWCLNQHPDILCSHGGGFPPTLITLDDSGHPTASISDAGAPIHSIFDIPYSNETGGPSRAHHDMHYVTVDDFLEAHRQLGDAPVMGNVHGFVLSELLRRHAIGEFRKRATVVNLVRQPIDQILSFHKRHKFDAERSKEYMLRRINIINENIDITRSISYKYDVDMKNKDNILFLSTVIDVCSKQKDIINENILHIPSELITTSKDLFINIIRVISGNKNIVIEDSFVRKIFSLGRMNYSNKNETPSEQSFAALDPWQRFAIRLCLTPEIAGRYAEIGYDMTFYDDRL